MPSTRWTTRLKLFIFYMLYRKFTTLGGRATHFLCTGWNDSPSHEFISRICALGGLGGLIPTSGIISRIIPCVPLAKPK